MPNKVTIQCEQNNIDSFNHELEQFLVEYAQATNSEIDFNYDVNNAGDKTIKITKT